MAHAVKVSDWEEYHAIRQLVLGNLEATREVTVALTRVSEDVLRHLEEDGVISVTCDDHKEGREARVIKLIPGFTD